MCEDRGTKKRRISESIRTISLRLRKRERPHQAEPKRPGMARVAFGETFEMAGKQAVAGRCLPAG